MSVAGASDSSKGLGKEVCQSDERQEVNYEHGGKGVLGTTAERTGGRREVGVAGKETYPPFTSRGGQRAAIQDGNG